MGRSYSMLRLMAYANRNLVVYTFGGEGYKVQDFTPLYMNHLSEILN